MTPRRRAARIRIEADWPWPYRSRCFCCLTGRVSPRWTNIHVYGQDVRGVALKCDKCGDITLSEKMGHFACEKALAQEARALRTSCSAITVDSAKTLYLVFDASGLRGQA